MSTREESFEKMLADVLTAYADITARMEKLKAEGREKTATYRELMGNKLLYQNILSLYRTYGLTEEK